MFMESSLTSANHALSHRSQARGIGFCADFERDVDQSDRSKEFDVIGPFHFRDQANSPVVKARQVYRTQSEAVHNLIEKVLEARPKLLEKLYRPPVRPGCRVRFHVVQGFVDFFQKERESEPFVLLLRYPFRWIPQVLPKAKPLLLSRPQQANEEIINVIANLCLGDQNPIPVVKA